MITNKGEPARVLADYGDDKNRIQNCQDPGTVAALLTTATSVAKAGMTIRTVTTDLVPVTTTRAAMVDQIKKNYNQRQI